MLNLDPAKLIVIAVVAIILLGPDRLPQVAKQVGAAWRSLNEFRHRMESEVRSTMPDLPPTSEIARLARSPSALLHHLSTMSDQDEQGDAAAVADGIGTADGSGAAGTGNGADAAAGENGAVPEATAPPPAPPQQPAPPAQPLPLSQPPVPDPAVPVDPSLN